MNINRRGVLKAAVAGGLTAAWPVPAAAGADDGQRILVVVELSGGNDGLNTIVPQGDDAYYRHRPAIGLRREALLPLDDMYGFNPGMLGFKRLWDDGQLAIVHGCGYDRPSYSHFTSMAYWHTGAPHRGNEFGWVGRLADALEPDPAPNVLVNIGSRQSLAVKSRLHTPVVFDDPERFRRDALKHELDVIDQAGAASNGNATRRYLDSVASSARTASKRVRRAWSDYRTPIDYGIAPIDLDKVAACIHAGLPTQLYYVTFRNNAFDTHVQQPDLHRRLLSYACDAIHGFVRDLERLGQSQRVSVLVFSEFGRRVGENTNRGTDHGSANVMFVAGAPVVGGHYGEHPDLTELNAEDNLVHTVDFRRVYATAIDGWLRPDQVLSTTVLGSPFDPLPVFRSSAASRAG